MSGEIDQPARPLPAVVLASGEYRYTRRLFDKVVLAFHHACDAGDQEVAERLLSLLDLIASRPVRAQQENRRRTMESLVAAHERLWHLRHPAKE